MTDLKSVTERPHGEKKRRTSHRSRTAYPYYNLADSIAVAEAVHTQGGGTCTRDQLATFLNYSTTKSGAFLTRVSAAKLFGLIETDKDAVVITDRARTIMAPVMPDDGNRAKVEAFLAVPLFSVVYDEFKGHTLPAEVGLKNLLRTQHQIVEDRVSPALRVLMESAEQAGFFKASGDRSKLVKPILQRHSKSPTPKEKEPEPPAPPKGSGSGGDDNPPGIHTAIVGLLREMPRSGTVWPVKQKERFMSAFRSTIDFIYPEDEEGE